jgi:hypothetical protein
VQSLKVFITTSRSSDPRRFHVEKKSIFLASYLVGDAKLTISGLKSLLRRRRRSAGIHKP